MSGAERLRRFKAKHGGSAAYRNKRKNQSPEERQKYLAWKQVEYALKSGKMTRKPCERCGALNAQAHHDDYSRPLEVMWLCPKDHKERHRELDAQDAAPAARTAACNPP